MSNKIKDARYQEQKIRKLFIARRDYLVRRWGINNPNFMRRFNILMQDEILFVWNTGKTRINSKLDFITNKMRQVPPVTRQVGDTEDIAISDK